MNAASGTVRWESSCREAAGLAGCFARYGPLRNAFLQGEIFCISLLSPRKPVNYAQLPYSCPCADSCLSAGE